MSLECEMTKILIIAHHYPVASARYMADAFERLGCEVYHTGPSQNRNVWGLTLPPCYEWTANAPFDQYLQRKQWDLVIVMDSDPFLLDIAAGFADPEYAHLHEGRKLIVYGVDNHVRNYRRPHFDQYFLAHRHASVMEWDEDTDTYLPCAYDPIHFTPSPIPYSARKYDVALLGVMYPERLELVTALQAAGLSVIWGTGLVYDSYKEAHHNARVSLCHNIAGDLNQRVFECGAMRTAVVINEPCHDLQAADTNQQLALSGFILYRTVQQAVDVCKEIVKDNPALGEKSTNEMYKSCAFHTWDTRAQAILDWHAGKPVTIPHGDDVLTTIVGD